MTEQTLMEREAREAPEVAATLARAGKDALAELGARLRHEPPLYALAAGRGSSGAACLLAKYLFEQRLGVPTAPAALSIQSVYGRRLKLNRALALVISQSGRSPDLIEFCRTATGPSVMRVGLINDAESPLAQTVDVCLPLHAGAERSVAATKSCLAAMLLAYGLTAHWAGDAAMLAAFARAPDALAAAIERDWPAAERFLEGDAPLYVVGRGPALAIAKEAALKLKETNGLVAEAISAAELRHGPFALAGPNLRVIMFAPNDAASAGMRTLRDELAARGSPVLFIGASSSDAAVAADPEPVLELLAMLQRFYLLAATAAVRRGRSPDAPPSLAKITETR